MDAKTKKLIIKGLRELTIKWHVKNDVLKAAKVYVENGRKADGSMKYSPRYKCDICGGIFVRDRVEVDHIVEVGSFDDWNGFVERLFCDADNLQILCVDCHLGKTSTMNMKSRSRQEDSCRLI